MALLIVVPLTKNEKWFSGQETHGWQVTVPVSLAKDPSGHAVQAAAPERLVAVPTAHGMQTEAFVLPGIGLALKGDKGWTVRDKG